MKAQLLAVDVLLSDPGTLSMINNAVEPDLWMLRERLLEDEDEPPIPPRADMFAYLELFEIRLGIIQRACAFMCDIIRPDLDTRQLVHPEEQAVLAK